jgi:Ser/Thr protein kinase RdoA (MazF antagonist)
VPPQVRTSDPLRGGRARRWSRCLADVEAALTEPIVRRVLRDAWSLSDVALTALDGGMNSRTWLTTRARRRWVVKAVPSGSSSRFVSGLAVAELVDRAGTPSGAPVRTRDDRVAVSVADHTVALLTWVPGEPLAGRTASERRLIGATLGRVHAALRGRSVPGAERFHWVDPAAPHLDLAGWIRPAVEAALARYDTLAATGLTRGLLHTDPAPEAFRLDARTMTCGLIDWDSGLEGPLLYDLASAVMYAGGPGRAADLVDAYVATGSLDRAEVDRGLGVMLAFRWAVQADYFARRIVAGDLTGIRSAADNDAGLEDARRSLDEAH